MFRLPIARTTMKILSTVGLAVLLVPGVAASAAQSADARPAPRSYTVTWWDSEVPSFDACLERAGQPVRLTSDQVVALPPAERTRYKLANWGCITSGRMISTTQYTYCWFAGQEQPRDRCREK